MTAARILLAASAWVIAGCGCGGPPPGGAQPPASAWLDPGAPPVPADRFAGLTGGETLGELVRRLGPAHQDTGSGLYVLEWRVADGRRYRASVTALEESARPLAAGFHDR